MQCPKGLGFPPETFVNCAIHHFGNWVSVSFWGRSPGLGVMGGASCPVVGLNPSTCMQDGHFSHIFSCIKCNIYLKKAKIN